MSCRQKHARRGVVALVAVLALLASASSASPRSAASVPVVTGWSLSSGTAGCECIWLNVILTSDAPTVVRVEWGTTSALGWVAGGAPVPFGTGVSVSLKWTPPPAAGSYFARIVAENPAGSAATPVLGFTVGADGSVHVAPPTLPPPKRQGPPSTPTSSLSVSSTTAITVVVGDTVDVQATVTTNSSWLFTPPQPTAVFVTLPGLGGACTGCRLDAVDLVSATPTSGTCSELVICDFGPAGPNSSSSVTLRLRGKTPGNYQLGFVGGSSTVTIPFKVIPRVADLAVTPLAPLAPVLVGKTVTRDVSINNLGPNSVSDATLIVGSPRGVRVRASSADGTCTPVPIKCSLNGLAPGQSASVRLAFLTTTPGSVNIPIGISSREAGDSQTGNNSFRLTLVTRSPHPTRRRAHRKS